MMKKVKRGGEDSGGSNSNSIGDRRMISDLPEGILQRIIYFLSQEEAVRTSILSKSWRYNWCTRPNLDFSEPSFKGNKQQFLSAVDKTLQRYCDKGLCLEEFKVCISLLGGEDCHAHRESVSLLDKWITIILTTMGVALKEFRLSIVSQDFKERPCLVYDLIIDHLLVHNKKKKKVHFEHLQVLSLHKVLIKQELFDEIISSCTLLTSICFEECRGGGLKTINLDKKFHKYLKHFTFIADKFPSQDTSTIEINDVPTLETIKIVTGKVRFHGRHKFNNLKSVTLMIPCYEYDEISIDAPNLLYFEYRGRVIPSISFAPNCRSSNITMSVHGVIDALSWLSELSQLLQALRQSEISLAIDQFYEGHLSFLQDSLVPHCINGGSKPVVLKRLRLNIFHLFSFPPVFNGFLCICRPRYITQRWIGQHWSSAEMQKKAINKYLRTILMMRESGNQEIGQDLEALSIQRFVRSDKYRRGWKWKRVPGKMLLLESAQLNINNIHFQLKWSQACESSSKLHK